MARIQRITALANQAFELVNTDGEKLCTRPTKANPAQGLDYIVDEMRPGSIKYKSQSEDGLHSFTRPIKVNGGQEFQKDWTLTPTELVREIRRCIKDREDVPQALAQALQATACNARWNPPPPRAS